MKCNLHSAQILKIEELEEQECCDIEVENDSNYFLANGVLSHNSVDLDTRYEVNYAFAVQEITKMPEEIVKQCRYMMVPYSADVGTIKECLTISGLIRFTQTGVNEALRLKQSMKKYQWVIIDRTTGTKEIVSPLGPLSAHLLQGD